MPAKVFKFSVVDTWTDQVVEFAAEAATVDDAFKRGVKSAPPLFAGELYGPFIAQGWLRMFRFRIENTKTGEFTAALGQGETLLEAWSDVLKGAHDTFRPKNDGRARPRVGFSVLLPARRGDVADAVGRCVSREVSSFESDETYDQERARRAEEERRRRAAELNATGGKAA